MATSEVSAEPALRPRAGVELVGQARPYRMLLVHHMHWDREWWATFQDFRIRLVDTIDQLLDTLQTNPDFRTFLLDGQTIVLRDYLEIRPENRERLVRAIRAGRIECGPWYILPDEFLVSGEGHIRNLWLGLRVADDLGIPLQCAGYVPDTFGHIGQLPQIFAGFGIDNAFLWRGFAGAKGKGEFMWEAPDGSRVQTHWFPNGYYQMPFLHFGNEHRPYADKMGRIEKSVDDFGPMATTKILLLPYGGDHRPIDPLLAAKIAEANGVIDGRGRVEWSTLHEYVDAVRAEQPFLLTVRGELRQTGADHPHLLAGVLSARLYLKELNVRGQTWLERYAEPLSSIAWLRGRRYDAGLLWKAWELLVQNHPHDSICGCSIDQVHREMIPRFDQSRQIARILAERCAGFINDQINTSDLGSDERALVIHNPSVHERSGWAAVWTERAAVHPRTHVLLDAEGRDVPFQVRDVEGTRPMTDRWLHTEIGFVAGPIPGLGYQTYRLALREVPLDRKSLTFTALRPSAEGKGSQGVTDLAVGPGLLENRWLRVEANGRDGTLTVTDRLTGEVYAGLNAFEDGGDAGDTYTFAAPPGDHVVRSTDGVRVHLSLAEVGYARATLRVDVDWSLPEALSTDRFSRAVNQVETRLTSYVTLTAGTRRVDIRTEWENRSRDHRLRVLLPLGCPVRHAHALGHFEVVERPVELPEAGNGWPETAVREAPHTGWVAVQHQRRGLMIASRGLPEYEALDDGTGTIALTLLRAVGWLSREDIMTRAGGAGPTTPVPDAQCLGKNMAQYSIIPYGGDWLNERADLRAEEYLIPLFGTQTGRHGGTEPLTGEMISILGGHTLVLSAVKKAERDDALILRFWNASHEPTEATIRIDLGGPLTAETVDLREEPLGDGRIPVRPDGSFSLQAGPAQIVTVALRGAAPIPLQGRA